MTGSPSRPWSRSTTRVAGRAAVAGLAGAVTAMAAPTPSGIMICWPRVSSSDVSESYCMMACGSAWYLAATETTVSPSCAVYSTPSTGGMSSFSPTCS